MFYYEETKMQSLSENHNNSMNREEQINKNRKDASPVISDLVNEGYTVETISELLKVGKYNNAIPILLKWLPQVDNLRVKESIVRALSVPWARPLANKVLIEEFAKANNNSLSFKWATANAISIIADDDDFDDIVNLLKDETHGKAREMLTLALGNIKSTKAEDALIELLDDETCAGHAIMALAKLKSKRSVPKIQALLSHSKSWVREEAKKAIIKIQKSTNYGRN
jgi:HEAT repeat protein